MCFSNKWALTLPVAGLLALAWCHAADPAPKDSAAPPGVQGLVVHEWGTFSTFSGSNGKNLKFDPYDNDLPGFVHGYQPRNSKSGPQGGKISLETPVLYFYSERPLSASVQVEFPHGTITEWYPHAQRTNHQLVWKWIKVLPQEKVKLPNETTPSRYYAARETEAAPLQVLFRPDNGEVGTEQEKFLFYRGVGDFDMPLSVRALGSGKLSVEWNGKGPEGDLILIQVHEDKVRFQPFRLDHVLPGSVQGDVQLPDSDSTVEKLSEAMVTRLTDRGLFEPEAKAMVKTWRSAWFGEEGTRVLYFLTEGLTDQFLPLHVEPKPNALLRVLVGRHDVLTPEREKQIDAWVTTPNRPTQDLEDDQRAAWEELCKLGRYRNATIEQADARLRQR
jgi:hypothetical protein